MIYFWQNLIIVSNYGISRQFLCMLVHKLCYSTLRHPIYNTFNRNIFCSVFRYLGFDLHEKNSRIISSSLFCLYLICNRTDLSLGLVRSTKKADFIRMKALSLEKIYESCHEQTQQVQNHSNLFLILFCLLVCLLV